jgi:hypothetical protein
MFQKLVFAQPINKFLAFYKKRSSLFPEAAAAGE